MHLLCFPSSETDVFSLYKLNPGEEIFISLYGAAIDYNIRLDKNTVKMENTFISCASQRYANPDPILTSLCSHVHCYYVYSKLEKDN